MTEVDRAQLERSIEAHDRSALNASVVVWIGAEPTFTDRSSEAPEWLSEALGEDKERRARQMITKLRERFPGAAVLRPLGRQYAGEPFPRFCYGIYARRDGQPVWSGPPDLLTDTPPKQPDAGALDGLRDALCDRLQRSGWFAAPCDIGEASVRRIVCRASGQPDCFDSAEDPRLARDSIHAARVTDGGPVDPLAAEGTYLILIHQGDVSSGNAFWLELPGFTDVGEYLQFLRELAAVCAARAVASLGLRGFAPPADDSVAWTTVTPDPAVLEINQAPEPSLQAFYRAERCIFELAQEVGLSPYRLQYNGEVSDSGGGGHLTFGGPSPAQSPFFVHPALLPRLVRYVIRHPALSYWFATPYVGGSSQSPRADEGLRGAFLELQVALEQLERIDSPTAETLWSTLRHFLADAAGNPHRSELNIEKLDNPFLPGRGRLGLVELRALAMPESLPRAIARVLLFRSILLMLAGEDRAPDLVDWGDALHDRFALPFYLQRDLSEVLSELAQAGFGLGRELEQQLLDRPNATLVSLEFAGARFQVEQALEFWPLVGDVASQEGGGSRTVDASTARLELRLCAPEDLAEQLDAIELVANGVRVPLRRESDTARATRICGLRHRSFVPPTGIHPTLHAAPQITLTLLHPEYPALRTVLHSWHPAGVAYPGLPLGLDEAAERRRERAVVERLDPTELPAARDPEPQSLTAYCLDLRRV